MGGRALELVTKDMGRYTVLHYFHNPLKAAASTGKTEAVLVLLKLAETELLAYRERVLEADKVMYNLLERTITLAIRANDAQSALVILAFVRKNVQPPPNKHVLSPHLVQAMKYGCVDLLKAILEEVSSQDDWPYYAYFKEGACQALISGRSNIIECLLANNLIPFHSKFDEDRDRRLNGTAMELAVKFGYSIIIDLLVAAGDVHRPTHLVVVLTKLLNPNSDYLRSAFFTIQHLIKEGVVIDRDALEEFENYAGKILHLRYNK
jgi:hypothetical protein